MRLGDILWKLSDDMKSKKCLMRFVVTPKKERVVIEVYNKQKRRWDEITKVDEIDKLHIREYGAFFGDNIRYCR